MGRLDFWLKRVFGDNNVIRDLEEQAVAIKMEQAKEQPAPAPATKSPAVVYRAALLALVLSGCLSPHDNAALMMGVQQHPPQQRPPVIECYTLGANTTCEQK